MHVLYYTYCSLPKELARVVSVRGGLPANLSKAFPFFLFRGVWVFFRLTLVIITILFLQGNITAEITAKAVIAVELSMAGRSLPFVSSRVYEHSQVRIGRRCGEKVCGFLKEITVLRYTVRIAPPNASSA